MTPEEAGEIILGSEAWVSCPDCSDNDGAFSHCNSCDGHGYIPNAEYVEACDAIGKDYPECPSRSGVGFSIVETIGLVDINRGANKAIRALPDIKDD